ncbi:mycofactocin radical SAM maturase [Streptomyces sp. NBC_00582]|uniref:mycofactocin radical SAM maturase n=1 Tax=Streptomyces sp. NBC_00582 TaxID=2975783 RepID=UPI0010E877F4|nr:mycofactocin radical SAM maturase [Streptomyces sp. NBC_00582]WUB59222.1 mycofactocin radical SAM maturase [Streptomyces sp. NBC_00582]
MSTESRVFRPESFGALAYDHRARRLTLLRDPTRVGAAPETLDGVLAAGLSAPVCLSWEWTYGCNLACVHCLSSSGRADARELSTEQLCTVASELAAAGVFYVNVGGGEPMTRPDFFEVLEHTLATGMGVKFSTNGTLLTRAAAARLAALPRLDVQISLDGADAATNDAVRGRGSWRAAGRAMSRLAEAGLTDFKISTVVTRHNAGQLDAYERLAEEHGAVLRVTRLRPSGRGQDSWAVLRPTQEQQRTVHRWLAERPQVLTADSFFHLSALGQALPGLGRCGAGRLVCLIDPIGDVYACPFALHEEFRAGSLLNEGGFLRVWREAELFRRLRAPQPAGACADCPSLSVCGSGCMAAKFFTGLPMDGPDPECVHGHGDTLLASAVPPTGAPDHGRVPRSLLPLVTR